MYNGIVKSIVNKKARYNYEILDSIEAGISLLGDEVKSIKGGQVQIVEGYIDIKDGEAWLFNIIIPKYQSSSRRDYVPDRQRKLLLKKREIFQLENKVKQGNYSLIPLKFYTNKTGKIKVEIGLCKGKKKFDKSRRIKEREMDREMSREKSKYVI